MSVMVAGGAGYIGSHAVKQLIEAGYRVVAVDNLCRGHRQAVDPRAEFCRLDLAETEVTRRLASLGGSVVRGHRGENVEGTDVVVYSSAVSRENVELEAARRAGIPVIPRAEMLAELMRVKYGVAVGGAESWHAKSKSRPSAIRATSRNFRLVRMGASMTPKPHNTKTYCTQQRHPGRTPGAREGQMTRRDSTRVAVLYGEWGELSSAWRTRSMSRRRRTG